MNGKADKRRPLVVAIALIAAIGAALVAPVMIGARRGEPIPGSTVRAGSHESIAITAPVTLFSSPAVTLEKGTVALVGPASDESGVGAVLRALMLGGGAELVLDGATLTVDRSGAPTPVTTAPEGLNDVVSTLSGFKFSNLTLLDTTVVVRTAGGATETISIINAEMAPTRHGLVTAKGQLEFRGEPLLFDIAFAQPGGKSDASVQVRALVRGKHAAISFDGRLATDHGQITAENAQLTIADVRRFAGWLGASWPAGSGLGRFTAKGRLTLEERAVSFEHAEFTLDGNAATGALMVKLGAERPSMEGTLAFPLFDIAPYATPSRPYALALASDWISSFRVPGAASPSFLREFDADIRISAANVMSGSDRLGRCAASLSVKGGKVYGEIAELDLERGGSGEGQFTADMTGDDPRYTVRAELNDIDLGTVVSPRLGPAAIDGGGDLKIDLAAHGASEVEVLGSLAGTVSLEMSEGGRIGFDLDALPRVPVGTNPSEGWGATTAGSTTVTRLNARFTAARGVFTVNEIAAAIDDRNVTAGGTVDVDKNALDLVLSIAPAAEAASPDPAKKALGSFTIQGPWSAPAIGQGEPGKAAGATASVPDPG